MVVMCSVYMIKFHGVLYDQCKEKQKAFKFQSSSCWFDGTWVKTDDQLPFVLYCCT